MPPMAVPCQQNYRRLISGHQRAGRKSIICQHLTCVFRVVKHCAPADNCPAPGGRGSTGPGSRVCYRKQRFPSTKHAVIQDAARLLWHVRQHLLAWERMRLYNQRFASREKSTLPVLISVRVSCANLLMPFRLGFNDLGASLCR